ncbi:MAG TPA: hypothetical protein PKW11_03765, partial [Pseudomonadota bacterium]|nr:hypothetical protein [Pseudomonadota bacterium]
STVVEHKRTKALVIAMLELGMDGFCVIVNPSDAAAPLQSKPAEALLPAFRARFPLEAKRLAMVRQSRWQPSW